MKVFALALVLFAAVAYGQVTYKATDEGIVYAKEVTTAIFKDGKYLTGPVVASKDLKVGDSVWWPNGDSTFSVQVLAHHNVTSTHDACCVGLDCGGPPPRCEAKLCCGGACCC